MKKDTRELLLDSAFATFYQYGYQGANIASILKDVGINKGSMYHFFKSKKELALAVVEERINRKLIDKYAKVLDTQKPIKVLFDTLREATETLPYGCPLNKMSQEMVYIDESFKMLLSKVYAAFEDAIEKILIKGIENGEIKSCETNETAKLIIATYEGALMVYHLNQDKKMFKEILSTLEAKL